jgi:hypothetical protein
MHSGNLLPPPLLARPQRYCLPLQFSTCRDGALFHLCIHCTSFAYQSIPAISMYGTASLTNDPSHLAEAQPNAGDKRKRQIVTAACERCRTRRSKVSNIGHEVIPEHP